jgi:ABC-type multidrug transport system fused ATPase/permease subunit
MVLITNVAARFIARGHCSTEGIAHGYHPRIRRNPENHAAQWIFRRPSGVQPEVAAPPASKISVKSLNFFYGSLSGPAQYQYRNSRKGITALIGPSGCGKSTFLRTLNRINEMIRGARAEGQVLLDGEDMCSNVDVTNLRRRVGMVFQRPNPFPKSIFDNVAYGIRVNGMKGGRIAAR